VEQKKQQFETSVGSSDNQISNKEEESIRNKLLPLILKERHLCMSITPKSHVMAAHSIEQLVRICGFTDLGEDAGERNHQDELKADTRLGAICDYPRKEEFMRASWIRSEISSYYFKLIVVATYNSNFLLL
jgi:hypothetical protein